MKEANRAQAVVSHAIALTTLVVILAATFALAYDIVFVLFLGVVFGVFLTKLSAWLSAKLSLGYRGSLALLVSTLLLLGIGASLFLFAQINQQLVKASGLLEEGTVELRKAVDQYPMLMSTIANIPLLSVATEEQPGNSKPQPDTAQRDAKSTDNNTQQETAQAKAESTDNIQSQETAQGGAESEDNKQDEGSSDQSGLKVDSVPQPVTGLAGKIGQLFKSTFGWGVNGVLIFLLDFFWRSHRAVIVMVPCAWFLHRTVNGSLKCSTRPRTHFGVG